MAGLGKGESSGGGGGGGGEMGFRFKPREAEAVEYYLLPRLQGRPPVPNPAIVVENVYEFEPERLINEKCNGGVGGEGEEGWYFLSPRDRKYRNGKRPSRSTEDKAGRWKASTGKTEGKDPITECYGWVKFCVTSLVYFKGPVKTEKKTKWLMREFTIPHFENKLDKTAAAGGSSNQRQLDQYVLCRIYTSPKKGADDGEQAEVVRGGGGGGEDIDEWAEACAVFDLGPETAEGSDNADAAAAEGDMRSAKQAGKRPVAAAAVAEQPSKRPWLPPSPSTPCDGGPSQAMGNRQVPMQGLSLMHNFPPPPTTFCGHAPFQQGFPVHNNRAQMRWPTMQHNCMPSPAHSFQPRPVQRRPVLVGQAPPQRRPVHQVGGHAPMHMHQAQWTPVHIAQAPMQQLPFDDWVFDPFDDPPPPMQQLPVMMNNYQPQAPMQLPPMMNNDQPAMVHGGELQAPMQLLPATTHGGEVQAPMPLNVYEEEQRPSQEDGGQCTNAEG
uniref:NAC domain-containing protein n=1 Tax=Oryza rufipogon TaxID=4529 RepID=A0A0E0PPY6_ORYRU